MDAQAVQLFCKLLGRNSHFKLLSTDFLFIAPLYHPPQCSFQLRLPSFVEDPYLYLRFLHQTARQFLSVLHTAFQLRNDLIPYPLIEYDVNLDEEKQVADLEQAKKGKYCSSNCMKDMFLAAQSPIVSSYDPTVMHPACFGFPAPLFFNSRPIRIRKPGMWNAGCKHPALFTPQDGLQGLIGDAGASYGILKKVRYVDIPLLYNSAAHTSSSRGAGINRGYALIAAFFSLTDANGYTLRQVKTVVDRNYKPDQDNECNELENTLNMMDWLIERFQEPKSAGGHKLMCFMPHFEHGGSVPGFESRDDHPCGLDSIELMPVNSILRNFKVDMDQSRNSPQTNAEESPSTGKCSIDPLNNRTSNAYSCSPARSEAVWGKIPEQFISGYDIIVDSWLRGQANMIAFQEEIIRSGYHALFDYVLDSSLRRSRCLTLKNIRRLTNKWRTLVHSSSTYENPSTMCVEYAVSLHTTHSLFIFAGKFCQILSKLLSSLQMSSLLCQESYTNKCYKDKIETYKLLPNEELINLAQIEENRGWRTNSSSLFNKISPNAHVIVDRPGPSVLILVGPYGMQEQQTASLFNQKAPCAQRIDDSFSHSTQHCNFSCLPDSFMCMPHLVDEEGNVEYHRTSFVLVEVGVTSFHLYAFNISSTLQNSLKKDVETIIEWNRQRYALLSCALQQKMGLFHQFESLDHCKNAQTLDSTAGSKLAEKDNVNLTQKSISTSSVLSNVFNLPLSRVNSIVNGAIPLSEETTRY